MPFVEIIQRLWWNYLSEWVFPVFHAVFLYDYLRIYWGIRRDYRQLAKWGPDAPQARQASSDLVHMLNQFVTSVGHLGASGLLVPMTDFSDRLDAYVEARVSQLHDRANGFLIIGLAGTLWVLAKFAVNVTVGPNPQVMEELVNAMGRAFPIGLVGLIVTALTQFLASTPEEKLRSALSEATRLALDYRQQRTRTQQQAVSDSAQEIVTAVEQVRLATEPLKQIDKTLSTVLTEVVEVFGERLEASLQLLQKEFENIGRSSHHLQESLNLSRLACEQLLATVGDLAQEVHALPKALQRVDQLLLESRENVSELSQSTTAAGQSLERSSSQFAQLSESLAQLPDLTASSLETLSQQAFDVWRQSSETMAERWDQSAAAFRGDLKNAHQNLLTQLTLSYKALSDAVDESARRMAQTARHANALLKEAVEQAGARVGEDLSRLDRVIRERYPEAVRDINAFSQRLQRMAGEIEEAGARVSAQLQDLTGYQSGLAETHDKIITLLAGLERREILDEQWRTEMLSVLRSLRERRTRSGWLSRFFPFLRR